MMAFLVLVHILVCVLLIVAVLIQQGKGASAGIIGGASQSFFGPSGGKTMLMKITVGLAVAFLLNSVLLALVSTRQPMSAVQAGPVAPATPPAGGTPPPSR